MKPGHEILVENLHPAATFEEGLAQGKLLYQRCDDCGVAQFYPRVMCSTCGSVRVQFAQSDGTGVVYAVTAVAATGDPYSVCLVDLDEGFRMMSTVVEMPAAEVSIGLRVACRFEQEADEVWRAVFVAAPAQ